MGRHPFSDPFMKDKRINNRVPDSAVENPLHSAVDERQVYGNAMADKNIIAAEFKEIRNDVIYIGLFGHIGRSDAVYDDAFGLKFGFRLYEPVKGFAEVDPCAGHFYAADGYDGIPPFIQACQFGVNDYKTGFRNRSVLVDR